MEIRWERQTEKYSNGEDGFIGKYRFFSIGWDGMVSGEQEERYLLKVFLPGIKSNLGHFKTPDLAKEKAKYILEFWLHNTNLEVKKGELCLNTNCQ